MARYPSNAAKARPKPPPKRGGPDYRRPGLPPVPANDNIRYLKGLSRIIKRANWVSYVAGLVNTVLEENGLIKPYWSPNPAWRLDHTCTYSGYYHGIRSVGVSVTCANFPFNSLARYSPLVTPPYSAGTNSIAELFITESTLSGTTIFKHWAGRIWDKVVPNTVAGAVVFPMPSYQYPFPISVPMFPPAPDYKPISPPEPGAEPSWPGQTNPAKAPRPDWDNSPNPGKDPDGRPDREKKPGYDYQLPPLPGIGPIIILPPTRPGELPINFIPPQVQITPGPRPGTPARVVYAMGGMPTNRAPKGTDNVKVQKKATVASAAGLVAWTGLHTYTEMVDFVVAMHNSLPYRKGGVRLSSKASKKQILNYMLTSLKPWRSLEPGPALESYLNQKLMDYVASLGSKATRKVSKDLGITSGLDRAVRPPDGLVDEDGNPVGAYDWVPRIDFRPDTGEVYVVSSRSRRKPKEGK